VGASWRETARWLFGALLLASALSLSNPEQCRAQLGSPLARTSRQDAPRAHERARALSAPGSITPPRGSEFGFDLAVATHVPISVGVEANLELPLGLVVRAHIGLMPEPYIAIINGIATGLGAYDADVASLVSRSGGNALVFRPSLGVRPFTGYGFEILAGYTLIAASTRVDVASIERATGQAMDWPGLESIGISAQLHAFHVELGWRATIAEHLVIRAALGWMHTLHAEARLDVPVELRARARGRIEQIEGRVVSALESYGFSPEARIAIGYRF
jgi:hypothetical protein